MFSSVQFSLVTQLCPTLRPHGLQHTRLPCPSPTPGSCSNLCLELVMPSNPLILCCYCSVTKSCPPLCNSVSRSMPGFPVHHQLPEPTQTHVHQISDASQPSHPLSSPSPPTFILSQHQGLSKWVRSSHQVAKVFEVSASASVLPMNIQDQFPLGWTG